ncbi:flagellar biosynthesis protein FlaG [Lysinibacillus sp. YS11]|uniref:flagellar protein FlaG n=1 Tax=unclassified Lysinibacillus TaxID=2636778 RepID=UPI000CA11727|nr:flagellar protein FlaG [Lysinibacillus sp. YS11]AUS85414.1 flagellar biosynthesis protein FlaG [Lysinibacillus sp. YS11]
MRISANSNVDTMTEMKTTSTTKNAVEQVVKQGSNTTNISKEQLKPMDNSEETKVKVQEAVKALNEMLEVTHNASKFMYHEGLERYYVTVVNKDTEEVVKEIPPRKLLDAFYEMKKMLGMIIDEKI